MPDTQKQKNAQNIRQCARWIVESGLQYLHLNEEAALRRIVIERWGCQLWVAPRIDDGRYIALLRIKGGGINYDIHCLSRKTENELTEVWLFKIAAETWAAEKPRATFLITQAPHTFAPRKILHTTEHFTEQFEYGHGKRIHLPTENLQLLYDMEPWRFPDTYKNSPLKDVEIHLEGKGAYKKSIHNPNQTK